MMTNPNIMGSGHVYVKPNHIDDDFEDNEA
jgi:hypothetical protein